MRGRSLRSADRAYVSAVLSIGATPQNWWRHDDPSGTTLTDFMAATNMTLTGSPTLGAPGLINRSSNPAIIYSATGPKYASVAASLIPSGDFTIEAVIKPSNVNTVNTIFTQGDGSAAVGIIILRIDAAGKLVFIVNGGTTATGTTVLSANSVYHIALSYTAANNPKSIAYINGVQEVTQNSAANYVTGFATIGVNNARGAASAFDGTIDEVRLYRSGLTADQIAALSAYTLTGPPLLN